jgi:hypothetical protein
MNHSNSNTTADDICGLVGYTATALICAWFGGRNLYVPCRPREDHPLARLIGFSAFRQLVTGFGGDHLAIPEERWRQAADRSKRTVALLFCQGEKAVLIAERTGLTTRRVNQLISEVQSEGLLELLKEPPTGVV